MMAAPFLPKARLDFSLSFKLIDEITPYKFALGR